MPNAEQNPVAAPRVWFDITPYSSLSYFFSLRDIDHAPTSSNAIKALTFFAGYKQLNIIAMVNNVEIQTQGYRIHQNQNTFFYFAF
ncbi:hypothetical protein AB733_08470 [Photobacterium swingsii]|uniref:Uncharacterized protein n=1 Tax=Photobacterium swingsii TaxID=680026 RepID=A0A0J8VER5_9GAMM|nr:hypothetical protein AB733_08470 [Photobacterium swingsii]PSW23511.1 hypothetical protein C9I94_15420 [Photobacterium swingsii]